MKDRLTKSEALTIICIAEKNLSVGETASNLYVTYQCVANRLQCIYDKYGILLKEDTRQCNNGSAEILFCLFSAMTCLLEKCKNGIDCQFNKICFCQYGAF